MGIGLSGSVTPGPLLAFNIREVLRTGFWAGPLSIVGHSLLELAIVVALSVGIAQLLESDVAGFAIGVAGGLFLLWMGWGMVRRPSVNTPSAPTGRGRDRGETARPGLGVAVGGVLVTLSNPYWSLWWATIGLGYMLWSRALGTPGVVSFYVGHILADFAWYALVAFALVTGRRIMSDLAYRLLIMACGLFLLGMGAWFISSGISSLRAALA